jgi:hypothetical protein
MKNIHLLPTEKPSRLHLWFKRLELCELEHSHTRNTQNIYITSDEEIKKDDNFLDLTDNTLWVNKGPSSMSKTLFPECKKIILTTDPKLIVDGVQKIDDEFLEWFIHTSNKL